MKSFQIGDLTIPILIVQGGMGIGISLSRLASAVASAGGIGTIAAVGVGLIDGVPGRTFRQNNIDGVIKEIRMARKLSTGVLAVNIVSVLTNFSELVATAIKEKIDIIFSGTALPLNLPKYKIKGSKTKLVAIVSSVRAAMLTARKWFQHHHYVPEAFVLEGPEAGSHLGFSYYDSAGKKFSLEELVADMVPFAKELSVAHEKPVPVIAGGGITSGRQIRKIIELSASAVQLGSSFIATKECGASERFKQVIISSEEKKIRLIKSPLGMPGRAIENDFILAAESGEKHPDRCKYNCIKSCNTKTTEYCIAEALLSAYRGNFKSGFVFSGANAHLINSFTTVEEVFHR
ncbi:MAG: nitronate monooxygenase [Bacteroidales bacterium]|nr:nitronate monooxygenase [Bacteroidales bacterium]